MTERERGQRGKVVAGARYLALASEFAVIVVAGVFIGYRIDEYLGTAPWTMLLLTIGGLYGAVRRLLWSLKTHS